MRTKKLAVSSGRRITSRKFSLASLCSRPGCSARPKQLRGSPGISNGVRGCLSSKIFVAQWEIGIRVAEELLAHVPAELFERVGDVASHGCGGSGAGGRILLSDSSDQTGDIGGIPGANGNVLRCGIAGRGGGQPGTRFSGVNKAL